MKAFKILIIPFLILAFSACSYVKVLETKADEDFNLAEYDTFNFYDSPEAGKTLSAEYQQELDMLKEEIARQLEARGLSQSPSPDLLVNIGAVVEEKVQTRKTDIREAPIYIGQRRYTWESKEVETGRYQLGTVNVHLVDREENKLLWKGVAESVLPKKQEKLRKNIEEGVSALFETIPYSES